jgi:O-antigen ligase/tetratricopeptide (TPR) repeat protein
MADSPLAEWLGHICDTGILGVIFAAPLFMGGRGPVGKFAIVLMIGIATIAWFGRQCLLKNTKWRWSGAEILILLGGLVVIIQLIPLPQSVLFALSPALREWLPLWQPDSPLQMGTWSTISLVPEDTRGGMAMYLAYALFFLVLVQRIETPSDLRWLVKSLALAAIGMAMLGMLQLTLGNGKFLWVYDHPNRNTFDKVNGTFQNQNHFAHFLALGIGPIIWWLQQHWYAARPATSFTKRSQPSMPNLQLLAKNLLAIGLGLVLVASLLTYSRGGVICVTLVTLITALIYWKYSLLGRKALIGAGLFTVVVGIALAIYGHERLLTRLTTLASGSLEKIDPVRTDLWTAQWKAIPQFPWFGTGVGSHGEVYRVFLEQFYDLEFTHGENGYFELLVETGFVGFGLLLLGFGCALRWCWIGLRPQNQDGRLTAIAGALLPGLIASLVQSLGDFVWYISACMTTTIVIAACSCRLYQFARRSSDAEVESNSAWMRSTTDFGTVPVSRLAVLGLTAIALVCSVVAINNRLPSALTAPDWDAYKRLAALKDSPGASMSERDKLASMESHLERVIKIERNDARALLRLAHVQLRRFELEQRIAVNPMGLWEIADAALASKFPSHAAQKAWLDVAIGENINRLYSALQHCKMALRLSPLEGSAYAYMAELCFLEDPRKATKQHYVQQAFQVRPNSGLVLLSLGKEAALAGDEQAALNYYQRALQLDPEVRVRMIEKLAEMLSVQAFLSSLQLDHDGLFTLYIFYRDRQRIEEAKLVGPPLAKVLVEQAGKSTSSEAAHLWDKAREVNQFLGNFPGAVECQRRVVELQPGDFEGRRLLATLLSQNGQHTDAVTALEWCLRRNPDDPVLKQELADVKKRMSEASRSAMAPVNKY